MKVGRRVHPAHVAGCSEGSVGREGEGGNGEEGQQDRTSICKVTVHETQLHSKGIQRFAAVPARRPYENARSSPSASKSAHHHLHGDPLNQAGDSGQVKSQVL